MEIPSPGLFSRWLSNAIHFDEFDIESIWSCIIQQQACTGARTHRLNIKAFMCDIIPVCLILLHEHDSDAIKIASSAFKLSEQKSLNLRCMAKIIIILSVWCWNMFCLYATFDVRTREKKPPAREKIMRLKRNQQIITLEKKQTFLIHIVSIVLCEFDDPLTFPMIFSLRILINELWWSKESEWMNK